MTSYKGYYRLKNPAKYVGNPAKIVFRSSWERALMMRLDTSDSVLEWNSEGLHIPYMSPVDNRKHNYHVDFVVKNSAGEVTLIEVKPFKETQAPGKPKKQTPKAMFNYERAILTFQVNQAKWRAANAFAETNGCRFTVITERELFKG